MIDSVIKNGHVTLTQACRWFEISRQAYYQMKKQRQVRQSEDEQILEWVRDIRARHPKMGGRKLFNELQPLLKEAGFKRGRDNFFSLLRQNDHLVPHKRSGRRTTWSGWWRCPNRLDDVTVITPNQVWVADITYISSEQGFLYLALVTDLFSRFILGYDLSASLAVEGALRALDQAITIAQPPQGLIHHSDHGVQYTCHAYRDRLRQHQYLSSMGEVGNCYDNAVAERVNGILKLEYRLEALFPSFETAMLATDQAVWLYNYERPHFSLGLRKPVDVHFPAHRGRTTAQKLTTSEGVSHLENAVNGDE